jgi:hypothetical protein
MKVSVLNYFNSIPFASVIKFSLEMNSMAMRSINSNTKHVHSILNIATRTLSAVLAHVLFSNNINADSSKGSFEFFNFY